MSLDDLTARPVAGRYDLIRMLGQGGMGTVWLAEDLLLQRRVAVKRVEVPLGLSSEDAAAVPKRVLREARAAARVAHPRLVMLFDVAEEDGVVYLVQELVEAPTLKQLVAEQGPLEPAEAAGIGVQLVEGLAAAHRAGVVHRDVKPANVMVLPDGGVKLADFGIASLAGDPQLTATGTIIGSPAFMAPEQATGSEVGPPADLWSLGATLYFAVEGEPPFKKAEALATLSAMLNDPLPPAPRAGALGPVLARFLEKDPAARPDVAEAGRLLNSAMGAVAAPAPAPPPPPVAQPAPEPSDTQVLRPSPTSRRPAAVAASPGPPEVPRRAVEAPQRQQRGKGLALVLALAVIALIGATALSALVNKDGPDQTEARQAEPTPSLTKNSEGQAPRAMPGTTVSPSQAPAGWRTHTDPDTGYRLYYPGGWRVEDRDRTRTDFIDPETGTYLRVDWTDEPGDSPEGAWQVQSKSFGERHARYQEIRIEPTTYKGHRAALWEYTYDQGGSALHAYNLGFVTGDYGFALNFQTREDQWAASGPIWERLRAGFQVPAGDD